MKKERDSAVSPSPSTRRFVLARAAAAGTLAGAGVLMGSAVADPSVALAANSGSVDWINVTTYGADPTGSSDSTTAIRQAIDAVPASGGVVYFPAGNYLVTSTLTAVGQGIYLVGDGRWATTVSFQPTSAGTCLQAYSTNGFDNPPYGGGLLGIAFDGTNAPAGSSLVSIGDLFEYQVDFAAQNMTGTGSIGAHFINTVYWCEGLHGRVFAANCTSHVVFDVGGATTSTGSFERCDLELYIRQVSASQNGVVFQEGAMIADGALAIRGNFQASASQMTVASAAVLTITGSLPASHWQGTPPTPTPPSQIQNSRLDIGVEADTNGKTEAELPYAPQTINFGSASNVIQDCYGTWDFIAAATPFAASNNNGNVSFNGMVSGDAALVQNISQFNWVTITSLPKGWSGNVRCKKLADTDLVILTWSLAAASGTVVTSGDPITTLPSFYYYPSDNKILPGTASGGGLSGSVYGPFLLSTTGQLLYEGPAFTVSGSTAYFYGQAVFPNSA
jgi:Pectate lyase superfamily protein